MANTEIRISLILPFYGVERYIGKCLESIYQQDIPEEQYEVICINDCSPDNSEQVVLQYAEKHGNLVLIRHEQNMKLGAARNTGLNAAHGKYVWFIDTDDYIRENCLSEILATCEQNDLEILHFNIQNNHGDIMRRLVPTDVISGPEEEMISEEQCCIEITYPWNRVYSREFLLNNGLWFNDLYGGDVIHTILAVNVCERIKNVDECYHYYRVDNYASDTKSPNTAQKTFAMNYVLAQAIDEIVPRIKPIWKSTIEECVSWRINTSLRGVLKFSRQEQQTLMNLFISNPSVYAFVLQKGNMKAKLLFRNMKIMRIASIIYNALRNIKNKLKNTR